ncbi:MAG: type II secretion system GspH family protein [Fischerella sp. CENA71]|nr:type II secretion system GspH family protein [Fischerella sp. CENA71]
MAADYIIEKLNVKLLQFHNRNAKSKLRGLASEYNQHDAGFSLLEVLVVIVMIGVLSAIAIPSWLTFVKRQQINKANDAVFAALQDAQQEAKKKKVSYSVSIRTDNNTPQIAIYQGSTPTNWLDLGRDLGIKPKQIILGTNLSNVNTNGGSVTYASAFDTNAPQTITFDYMGILASKTNNNAPDTGLKVIVAIPQVGNNSVSQVKRCVIVETLIGGMRTAKDTSCT